jgi:bifunctional non-homologous end joining protein LigD
MEPVLLSMLSGLIHETFMKRLDRMPSGTTAARDRSLRRRQGENEAALRQLLAGRASEDTLTVDGEAVALRNLHKLLWPPDERAGLPGFTKREYLAYLLRVAPLMLPHLRDRPLTVIRMPDGIHGVRWVDMHAPGSGLPRRLPPFVETVQIFSGNEGHAHRYLLCNNTATLVWLGQTGALELHAWHSRANLHPDVEGTGLAYAASMEELEKSELNRPDYVVFDIDPYIYSGREKPGAEPEYHRDAFDKAREVAFRLHDVLDELGLEAFVKTSGKTGIHVLVPIVRSLDYGAVRMVAEAICTHVQRANPRDISMEWSVARRRGKIFLDHTMNARAKSLCMPYSPRAVSGAPVSMPLSWKELAKADPLDYRIDTVMARPPSADPWRDLLRRKQRLEGVLGRSRA